MYQDRRKLIHRHRWLPNCMSRQYLCCCDIRTVCYSFICRCCACAFNAYRKLPTVAEGRHQWSTTRSYTQLAVVTPILPIGLCGTSPLHPGRGVMAVVFSRLHFGSALTGHPVRFGRSYLPCTSFMWTTSLPLSPMATSSLIPVSGMLAPAYASVFAMTHLRSLCLGSYHVV
jgi:hypothetical protein